MIGEDVGAQLTPEGALVVDWARDVLTAADRLTAAVGALQLHRSGHLRVAASLTVAEYLVPRWLAAYRERHGLVEVELTVANSEQVAAAVFEGACDLGFVETTELPAGVQARVVGRDHLVVVVSPDHPWVGLREPLRAAELAGTPLVVREEGSGTRVALVHACARAGLVVAEPAQALSSNAAVRVSAMAGVAPAVLSEHAVREAVGAGRLHTVPVERLDLTRPLRAVWRQGTRPSGA